MTRRARMAAYLWPIFLYGIYPRLCALRLVRRPQPRDPAFTEPDPIA